jgi:hypothetical protein
LGGGLNRPAPKIGPVVVLIALIFVGVAIVAVAAMVLLRFAQGTEPREGEYPDRERGEREVYEQLYGKRSRTVSAPLPAKPHSADPEASKTSLVR